MTVRQYARYSFNLFFIITALVNLAIFVLGAIFYPDTPIGYDAFLHPLLYGALSMIPVWIMYSRRELTVRQLIIRKILQVISLEAILTFVTFSGAPLTRSDLPMVLAFAVSVLFVYLTVDVVEWVLGMKQAKDLMKNLVVYQRDHSNEQ